MKYELIKLPYEANALEPVISKETLGFHHGKHLNAYVNNLNGLIEGTKYEDMPLEDIVKTADGGVFNNAGQILNHNLYFTQFRAPKADNKPTGVIAEWIDKQFGSFEAFKEEFTKKGAALFGSGWVWLSVDKDGVANHRLGRGERKTLNETQLKENRGGEVPRRDFCLFCFHDPMQASAVAVVHLQQIHSCI